ncbi:hypothetical protein PUMCH_002927 [Australozyma saopauloensis]|uniref:Proteasome-interacting protein CIC1 n=1 Tax=Australozyma saopauloensis TaxID=291208 RepID=A0AAX4HB38_9ASCO|nr:hypothetical protein PUMCH_002927 [[Candida] saopauloensis]
MAKKSKTTASPKTPGEKKRGSSVEGTPSKQNTKSPKTPAKSPKQKKQTAAVSAVTEKEFGYVSKKQATKAIDELKKYLERSKAEAPKNGKSDIFEDADEEDHDDNTNLYLKFDFKKYFSDRAVLKPKLIALSHPYMSKGLDFKTCLFVRDNLIQNDEDLEKLESAEVPTLKKVLTLSQLKTIYKTYEKRFELLDEYDLFVADDAVFSSIPNTLGKTFYDQTSKFPRVVRLTSTKNPKVLSTTTLLNHIQKALSSSAYLPPVGTELTIRVGSLDSKFTTEQLLANIQDVLKEFPEKDLVTVGLATTQLPTLPLFYTDKIYGDQDVLENVKETEVEEEEDDAYTKALLELADEETVAEVLGKKFRESRKRRKLADGKVSKA